MNALVPAIAGLLFLCAPLSPASAGDTGAESVATGTIASTDDAGSNFDLLVAESGMRFDAPAGFHAIEPGANPLLATERALVNGDGSLEIRYALRPLVRIQVDYDDPHGSTPDPNHMFPLMFQSMVGMLSNGRNSPTGEYPAQQAREKFNADWAAASVFDISDDFTTDHAQALLVAVHRSKLADAYMIFLFDDYGQVKQQINEGLGSLAFLP